MKIMEFIRKDLNNGSVLYVLPMPQAHSVVAGVLIRVGSQDEQMPNEAGLAHALEHMFSQGTERFSDKKALSEFIEEIGGYRNARTNRESTLVFNQVPHEEFERSIIMLSEQIQHSLFRPNNISSEMKVITQEIDRAHDTPSRMVMEKTCEHIFKDHPLSHMVLGSKESVLNFKRDDFISFMDRHYYPENYTFLVIGNVHPEKAEDLINKYFKKEKTGKKKDRPISRLSLPEEKEYVEYGPIKQAQVVLAAPIESATEKEKFALRAFSIMLSSGSSSPLFDEIRTKRGLCYSISSSFYPGRPDGLFSVYLATGADKHKEATEAIFGVLEKTKNNAERLKKSKIRKIGGLALGFENPFGILSSAAADITFFDHPFGFDEIKNIAESITIKDVNQAVDKYLPKERFYSVMLLPEK